jgi:hypothetical protein
MAKWKLILCFIGSVIHLDVHAIAMELYFEGTFVEVGLVDPAGQSFELLGRHVSGSINYETDHIPYVQNRGPSPGGHEGSIFAGTDQSAQNSTGAALDEWMTVKVFIEGTRQSLPVFSDANFGAGQLQHDDNVPIAGSDKAHDQATYSYTRRAQIGSSEQEFHLELSTGSGLDLNPIPGFNIANLLDITSPFDISADVLGIGLLVRPSTLDGVPLLEPLAVSFAVERLKLSVFVPDTVAVPIPRVASVTLGLAVLMLFVFTLNPVGWERLLDHVSMG